VPVLVVDLLEMIQVEDEHSQAIAIAVRSGNLLLQTLFTESPVVQTGERIKNREAIKLLGANPLPHGNFHLLGQVIPEKLQVALLEKRVNVEKQHQSKQRPDDRGRALLAQVRVQVEKPWKRKHRDRGRDQHNRDYGIPPEPQIASIQTLQALPNRLLAGKFGVALYRLSHYRWPRVSKSAADPKQWRAAISLARPSARDLCKIRPGSAGTYGAVVSFLGEPWY
jgi:hypothetical protein